MAHKDDCDKNEAENISTVSEEVRVATHEPVNTVVKFNIEILRCVGLFSITIILVIGIVLTVFVTKWPDGNSKFDSEATYIYELFGLNHSCIYIDFNPSRTVSAFLMAFLHIIPTNCYTILNYFRIQCDFKKGRISKRLEMYNKITTPIIFFFTTTFILVFVNQPLDLSSFVLHYIPYFTWQGALCLMEIGQISYLIEREKIPFNIPKQLMRFYYVFFIGFWMFFSVYVWAIIGGFSIINTSTAVGLTFVKMVIYAFSLLLIIIPTIFAYIESKDPEIGMIFLQISNL